MSEMPLGHFGYQPTRDRNWADGERDRKKRPRINDTDHKLLTTQRGGKGVVESKLRDVLERLKQFNINVIVLEPKVVSYAGVPNINDYKLQTYQYITDNKVETKGHITFVKAGSSGHPLTAWQLLHTLGHALLKDGDSPAFAAIYDVIQQMWRDHNDQHGMYTKKYIPLQQNLSIFGARLFKFVSAKAVFCPKLHDNDRSVNGMSELIFELVAEYLWHGGKIRIQDDGILGQTLLAVGDEQSKYYDLESKPVGIDRSKIQNYVSAIESSIRSSLQNNVGQILYDYVTDI